MGSTSNLRRRSSIAVGSALLALVVTACAPTLPTDGPVEAAEAPVNAPYQFQHHPEGPQDGAAPQQIVEGFINAGTGPQNDYEVAREFLTPEAAQEWHPGSATTIYAESPTYQSGDEDVQVVQVEVEAVLDSFGSMSRPDAVRSFTFEMEVVDDEWRISTPPDGVIISNQTFETAYTAVELPFFDQQKRYTVPDMRWFVQRPGLPADVTTAVLNGPASWMEQAVVSAFSGDAQLGRPTVPTENRVASVDLSPVTVAGATPEDLLLMQLQLERTLQQLDVSTVELTAGQESVEIPSEDDVDPDDLPAVLDTREGYPSAGSQQVGVLNGQLMLREGESTTEIEGLPDLSELAPSHPALPSESESEVYSFLDGAGDELYRVRPGDSEPELLYEGEDLVRPSMDNFGWTWTADSSGDDPEVVAFDHRQQDAAATEVEISAEMLEGRDVTSLRIAQDGSRAALVVDDSGERTLYLAAVVRDSDGVPQQLGPAIPMDTTVPIEEVRWADHDRLYVWAPYDPETDEGEDANRAAEEVTLQGDTNTLNSLLGLISLSVGEGQPNIHAETEATPYADMVGTQWSPDYEVEIRDLSYPG